MKKLPYFIVIVALSSLTGCEDELKVCQYYVEQVLQQFEVPIPSDDQLDKTTNNPQKIVDDTDKQVINPKEPHFPVTQTSSDTQIYYGADLSQFPPKIRKWIMEESFSQEKMEGNGQLDPQLKAWWSDDGNEVKFEASYIIPKGYVGAGSRKIWGTKSHYSGGDLSQYGAYKKYNTLKYLYQLKLQSEELIKHDPAYAEIIDFAKKLSSEMEYDWSSLSAYRGAKPVKTPNKTYAVCEGYANEVTKKALKLHSVASVEEWIGPNHKWNVFNLVDGRRLYVDLTWFDNEHINEKTGEIDQLDDYKWANISFDQQAFKYSNIGYGSGEFTHAQGKFYKLFKK